MKVATAVRCDDTTYKIARSLDKRFKVVLIVDDGNIEGYKLRLTLKAARKLGQKLVEAADLEIVREVLED